MKVGARLVSRLHTPLLEPCWSDNDILDWDLVEYVEPQLSGGEQAVLELARSLDGQGNCNLFHALSQIDGYMKDAFADSVRILIDRMPR